MSIGKLIGFFSTFTKLPIYAEDVRDQIIELGIQDEINFVPLDVPAEQLLGMFVRSRSRRPPYSEHRNQSTVFYNANVAPDLQNFICCKELMHVFDAQIYKGVGDSVALNRLVEFLFEGPPAASDEAPEISGAQDLIATFIAAAVMFPQELREDFAVARNSGKLNNEMIATELGLPATFVQKILDSEWDSFIAFISK